MTIFTKSALIKKPDSDVKELLDDDVKLDVQVVVDDHPLDNVPVNKRKIMIFRVVCYTLVCMMAFVNCVIAAALILQRYSITQPIAMDINPQTSDLIEPHFRVIAPRWPTDSDVEVISFLDNDDNIDFENQLKELLDIGDTYERIVVPNKNNERHTIIHDFESNATGIISSERCFVLGLDPEVVLAPSVLIMRMESSSEFDVTPMIFNMRALLPPLTTNELSNSGPMISHECSQIPAYRLFRQNVVIKKRSAESMEPDFTQFSGNHIQEINVNNMNELKEYEEKNKNIV